MNRELFIASGALALTLMIGALAAAPPSSAQSSVRLPPTSGMLGDIRRGRDGQIEIIPGSDPTSRLRGARARAATRSPEASQPPAGTPWLAKEQHPRTPQPRAEESDSAD